MYANLLPPKTATGCLIIFYIYQPATKLNSMNKRYALLSVLLTILFLSNCTKDKGMLPKAAVINACDTITYSKHILPIMQGICYSCHGAGTSFAGTDKDWTVFANIKYRAD